MVKSIYVDTIWFNVRSQIMNSFYQATFLFHFWTGGGAPPQRDGKRSKPSRRRVKNARLGVQRAPRRAHFEFESPRKLGEVYTSETPNRMRGGVYISMRSPLRYIGISFLLSFEDRGLEICVCTPGTRAHTTNGADF